MPMLTVCTIGAEPSTIFQTYNRQEKNFILLKEFSSGSDALEQIPNIWPDIFFIDIDLPDMTGLSLSRYIRQQSSSCHIILLGCHRDFDLLLEALRLGVDDFLIKPSYTTELNRALDRIQAKRIIQQPILSEDPTDALWKENVRQLMDFHMQTNYLKNNNLIYLAAEYIETHLTDPELTLKKIAAIIYTNDSYLSHTFKREMGISMTEYITRKRIAESIHLLDTTNLKVYQISEQVGFRNPHYFGICFKKQVGITIKEYREQSIKK